MTKDEAAETLLIIACTYGFAVVRPECCGYFVPPPPPTLLERACHALKIGAAVAAGAALFAVFAVQNPRVFFTALVFGFVFGSVGAFARRAP